MTELCDNCRYFHEHGIKVGAWIWTFLIRDENSFTHMQSPEGKVSASEVCPSDAQFRDFAAEYLK